MQHPKNVKVCTCSWYISIDIALMLWEPKTTAPVVTYALKSFFEIEHYVNFSKRKAVYMSALTNMQ